MRKWLASTILALTGLVATAPAAWAEETQCTGLLPPDTYKTVVVPEGAVCEIDGNTTVDNVEVRTGGTLVMGTATITGNISGGDVEAIVLERTEVGKNLTLGGGPAALFDAEIGGNVTISGNEGGALLIRSTVGGNVTVVDTSSFLFIEANEIGRNLSVQDGIVPVTASIRLNTVGKMLTVTGLTGPGNKVVTGNTAGVVVSCHGNEQPFTGGPNTAPVIEGQCF